MSKFVLLLAFCCLCLLAQVQAQSSNANQCRSVYTKCKECERRTGAQDDVSRIYNAQCRRTDRRWKTITRCQLDRAACELTLVNCSALSCANVARVLRA